MPSSLLHSAEPGPGVAPAQATLTRPSISPPWHVVIYNDPVNLMSYVSLVIRRVFGYDSPKANHLMLQVHRQGRSIVWTGPRERAELYVKQLHEYLLLAAIEPASH